MKKLFLSVFLLCCALTASASATEFSADLTMVMGGQTRSGKIYYKNPKMLRQDMMGMILITKHPVAYQFFQDSKQYLAVDMEQVKIQNPIIYVDNFEQWFKGNNMKKIGTESVQGYKCVVYEGDVKVFEDEPSFMKCWYSPNLEYPIKTEIVLPAPLSGKMISTIENIKTGEQPADLFKIPSGYTKVQNVK